MPVVVSRLSRPWGRLAWVAAGLALAAGAVWWGFKLRDRLWAPGTQEPPALATHAPASGGAVEAPARPGEPALGTGLWLLPGVLESWVKEALDRPVTVDYHQATLEEMAADLTRRSGIQIQVPGPLRFGVPWSLTFREKPLREVLEGLAGKTGLGLACGLGRAFFWRPAGKEDLEGWRARLREPEVQARCETVFRLGQFTDPQVQPLILEALQDQDPAVRWWAAGVLHAGLPAWESWDGQQRHWERLGELFQEFPAWGADFPELAGRLAWRVEGAPGFPGNAELLLDQASLPVRQVLVEELGRSGGLEALPWLRKAFRAPDTAVSELAGRLLGGRGDPVAFQELLVVARSREPGQRRFAARGLGYFAVPDAERELLGLLADPQAEVAGAAIQALGLSPVAGPRAVAGLREAWERQGLAHLKSQMITALRQIGSDEAVEALLRALAEEGPGRLSPAFLFRELGLTRHPRAVQRLMERAGARSAPERPALLAALTLSRHPQALDLVSQALVPAELEGLREVLEAAFEERSLKVIQAFLRLLPQAEPGAQANLAYLLGRHQELEWAARALERLAGDSRDFVRASVARSFSLAAHPQALPALRRLAQDPEPAVRISALQSLGALQDPRAAAILLELSASPVETDRAQAVYSLGLRPRQLGAEALVGLGRLVGDGSPSVRLQLASTLRRLTDPQVFGLLVQLAEDADPQVQLQAAYGLADLRADPAQLKEAFARLFQGGRLQQQARQTLVAAWQQVSGGQEVPGSPVQPVPPAGPGPGGPPPPSSVEQTVAQQAVWAEQAANPRLDAEARLQAAQQLATRGGGAGGPALFALLRDTALDEQRRLGLAVSLAVHQGARMLDGFAAFLADRAVPVMLRVQTAGVLAVQRDAQVKARLLGLSADAALEPELRAMVCAGVVEQRVAGEALEEGLRARLMELVSAEQVSLNLRCRLLRGLVLSQDPQALTFVLGLLEEGQPQLRPFAIGVLSSTLGSLQGADRDRVAGVLAKLQSQQPAQPVQPTQPPVSEPHKPVLPPSPPDGDF